MPATQNTQAVLAALSVSEHCAQAVSRALLDGAPEAVESASRDFQGAAMALVTALQGLSAGAARDPQLRQRLVKVAQAMSMQREALLRRQATVERSLHSIMPASRGATYGAAMYGQNTKQSGAFRLLSA